MAKSRYQPRRSAAKKAPPVALTNISLEAIFPAAAKNRPAVAKAKPRMAQTKIMTKTRLVRSEPSRKTSDNIPSANG